MFDLDICKERKRARTQRVAAAEIPLCIARLHQVGHQSRLCSANLQICSHEPVRTGRSEIISRVLAGYVFVINKDIRARARDREQTRDAWKN